MINRNILAIAVWGACAALLWVFASGLTPLSLETHATTLLTTLVTNAVLLIGALVCLWYLATATALLVSQAVRALGIGAHGLDRLISRVGAPLLRRVALWGTVGSLALGSPTAAVALGDPASADSLAAESVPHVAAETHTLPGSRNAEFLIDLGWPTSTSAAPAPTRPVVAEAAPEPQATHMVQSGDTLWAIAEAHLVANNHTADPAQIAAHWPRWHAENIDIIGTDPNVITPGLRLTAPSLEES